MYKQLKKYNFETGQYQGLANAVLRLSDNATIPFDPANTDYANFKKEILADEAQLQDADGVIMADAKAYVASLP
jgi:site-specific DNA-adenine methylase